MPPLPQSLHHRASPDMSTIYPILFPILAALIFVGALFWGYCFARWQNRRSQRRRRRRHPQGHLTAGQSVRGAQFRYVFPQQSNFVMNRAEQDISRMVIPCQQTRMPICNPQLLSASPQQSRDVSPKLASGDSSQIIIPPRRMPFLVSGSPSRRTGSSSPPHCKKSISGSSNKELILVNKCEGEIRKPPRALLTPQSLHSSNMSDSIASFKAKNLASMDESSRHPSRLSQVVNDRVRSPTAFTPRKLFAAPNQVDTPSSWTPSFEPNLRGDDQSASLRRPVQPFRRTLTPTVLRRNACRLGPCRRLKGSLTLRSKQITPFACKMSSSPTANKRESAQMARTAFRSAFGEL